MAAPVLSVLEQKNTLSGKKKKKKTVKNILGLPNNIKVETTVISSQEAEKLRNILERYILLNRLLPTAKLPLEKNKNHVTKGIKQEEKVEQLQHAKAKRKQLSLGVNDLNRNIKKKIISSALLASDIHPKFLVHHINLLCNHNNIPLLQMPDLRHITHQTLGFPCICLGFKINSDFSEAVEEIKSLVIRNSSDSRNIESSSDSCNSNEDTNDELMPSNKKTKQNDIFEYFYRTSIKERMFIPNFGDQNFKTNENLASGFLSLNVDDNDLNTKLVSSKRGISSNLISKRNKRKKLSNIKEFDVDETNDNEDFEVVKKKVKKDWLIDKVGTKTNFRYFPTNAYKLHSNPNRKNKNK